MLQPVDQGQPTGFAGYLPATTAVQVPSYQPQLQPMANEHEGFAVSGNNLSQTQNANVTAQLQQLQMAPVAIPDSQAVPPSMPQQQFVPQTAVTQQPIAPQQVALQQITVQQITPQQVVEPQFQPPSNPPTFVANATSVSSETPVGSFESGLVRKQPTTGLGVGNSLGVVAAVSDKPTAATLPSIALDGYCPVSLAQTAKWVKGNTAITMEYNGVVFRFATAEAQNTFATNPGLYAPVLRGNDAVELLTNRREVAGHRKFGAWYHGQVFLFANAENYEKFQNNPELYAFQARQTANTLAAAHSPTY